MDVENVNSGNTFMGVLGIGLVMEEVGKGARLVGYSHVAEATFAHC